MPVSCSLSEPGRGTITAPGLFRAFQLCSRAEEMDIPQVKRGQREGRAKCHLAFFPCQTSSSLFSFPLRILSLSLLDNAAAFHAQSRTKTRNHNSPKAMTERELIDLTAAEAALEVDATADDDDDDEEQGGLATAETTAVERAATHRARAIPRVAMVGFRASGGGAKGGSCSGRGAAGRRRGEGGRRIPTRSRESGERD